jgi:hypothetical protein
MLITKEIKIKRINNITTQYIEAELNKLNLDVLSWVITNFDDNFLFLNISIIT